MATPKGTQLLDLDVERVDGVDKPATGRKFLLAKSEAGAAQIPATVLKGYGMLATIAAEVLKQLRKDAKAQMSVKTATAVNGLAQVLEQEPVFTSKSVPTQPYEFSEPDENKRGPADEKIGANFTPHAMPGSMVGAVQFREKSAVAASQGAQVTEDVEATTKAKKDEPAVGDKKPGMDEAEMKERGMAKAIGEAVAAAIAPVAEALKAQGATLKSITKAAGLDEEPEAVATKRPVESRQPKGDERQVEKSADHVSFSNIVFPGRN